MSSEQTAITILNHCGIVQDRGDEFERQWFDSTKKHILAEIDREVKATVAELVGLLKMGHDLREEAFEQGLHTQGVPRKAEAARLEVVRILALYDAAIAKHWGR